MTNIGVSEQLKDNYRDYYRDGHSEWRQLCAIGKADNIVRLCREVPHDSILEIGAGEGAILQRLSDVGFGQRLYALEISPSGAQEIDRKKIGRLVECKMFDGYAVPFESDAFDVAVLSHVIEHVEHPRHLLYEAARVARYVFVEVPLEDTVRLSDDFVLDTVGHINFYSPRTIRRLLQSCGLRVLDQIVTNPSRAVYVYQKGRRGLAGYAVKQAMLAMLPGVATRLFTYHGSLVCERQSR